MRGPTWAPDGLFQIRSRFLTLEDPLSQVLHDSLACGSPFRAIPTPPEQHMTYAVLAALDARHALALRLLRPRGRRG